MRKTKKALAHVIVGALGMLLSGITTVLGADSSPLNREALQTQYVGKVLIFRKSYRLLEKLEVNTDGTVKANHQPGYWSVDGALQVNDVEVHPGSVTLKGAKLWANLMPDGQIHYFPAAAALKGKSGYSETAKITFRTNGKDESLDQFRQRVDGIFFGEQEPKLNSAPAAIAAYIRKDAIEPDIDRAAGKGLDLTPPEVVQAAELSLTREASLVGQAGHQISIVMVDIEGHATVVTFLKALHFGLEESTIETLKEWKFKPAIKDGKPVPCRIALDLIYKKAEQN